MTFGTPPESAHPASRPLHARAPSPAVPWGPLLHPACRADLHGGFTIANHQLTMQMAPPSPQAPPGHQDAAGSLSASGPLLSHWDTASAALQKPCHLSVPLSSSLLPKNAAPGQCHLLLQVKACLGSREPLSFQKHCVLLLERLPVTGESFVSSATRVSSHKGQG